MGVLAAHGYERVKPPLVEFEETLFAGAGAMTASETCPPDGPGVAPDGRVRADMTPQVARIPPPASPRAAPLRLSYAARCCG